MTSNCVSRFWFFFFNRRCNPWWVLACFTISFHNLLSLHFCLQFLTFIFFKFSSTWSSHLSLGLPTGLDEHGSPSVTFLTILVVSILITCAAHRNLCDFINLTIFFFFCLIRISNSSFVFILHVPSLSNVGPYVFLSTLLSKTSRQFCTKFWLDNYPNWMFLFFFYLNLLFFSL